MRKKVNDTETSTAAKSNVNDCFVKVEHLQIKSYLRKYSKYSDLKIISKIDLININRINVSPNG